MAPDAASSTHAGRHIGCSVSMAPDAAAGCGRLFQPGCISHALQRRLALCLRVDTLPEACCPTFTSVNIMTSNGSSYMVATACTASNVRLIAARSHGRSRSPSNAISRSFAAMLSVIFMRARRAPELTHTTNRGWFQKHDNTLGWISVLHADK